AKAKGDATVIKQLRAAGAVILGKANLTEFANIIAIDMPSGYSSLGGQVKNPYSTTLLDDRGIPVVLPGGSSAGSAVAVAAGLCAAAIGTETSGSLLSPATQNGVVTVKPTVGLISRAGMLPARSKAVMAQAITVLQDAGATIVRASIPTAGWIGGPGTTMGVLNRNPLGRNKGNPATPPIVFIYELKRDLNLYLKDWAVGT